MAPAGKRLKGTEHNWIGVQSKLDVAPMEVSFIRGLSEQLSAVDTLDFSVLTHSLGTRGSPSQVFPVASVVILLCIRII